jgi:hypothetical protein
MIRLSDPRSWLYDVSLNEGKMPFPPPAIALKGWKRQNNSFILGTLYVPGI